MGLSDQENNICLWIQFVMAIISVLCTLLTLFLIYVLKKRNGYMLLLVSMCVCQIVYDIGFLTVFSGKYDTPCYIREAIIVVGGLSVALWTNILSFIVLYVIKYLTFVDIVYLYPVFCLIAVGFPVALSCFSFPAEYHNQCTEKPNTKLSDTVGLIYMYSRLASAVLNFVIYGWTVRVSRTRAKSATSHDSVDALVNRMKYYALVQGVFRIGPTIAEMTNRQYFIPEILLSVFAPATGIAYFLVYLVMQTGARRKLEDYNACVWHWITCQSDLYSDLETGGGRGSTDADIRPLILSPSEMSASLTSTNSMDQAAVSILNGNNSSLYDKSLKSSTYERSPASLLYGQSYDQSAALILNGGFSQDHDGSPSCSGSSVPSSSDREPSSERDSGLSNINLA